MNHSKFLLDRSELMRKLRLIGGGVTDFKNNRTRMYFGVQLKNDVAAKLKQLCGDPLSVKPLETVWWCENLGFHIKMVTGQRDVYVTIPSAGGEVKGAFA